MSKAMQMEKIAEEWWHYITLQTARQPQENCHIYRDAAAELQPGHIAVAELRIAVAQSGH